MRHFIMAAMLTVCSVASGQDIVVNGVPWGQTGPTDLGQRDAAINARSTALADLATAAGNGGNPMLINLGYAALGEFDVYIARGDVWLDHGDLYLARNTDTNRHNDSFGQQIRGYRMAWYCYSNALGMANRASRFAIASTN